MLVRVAQLVATVLVTWFVITRAGFGMAELQGLELTGWRPDWALIVVSSVILFAGYFSTGFLWGRIVHDLGGPAPPVFESVGLFMIANLGRYVPGKVWQIAGLAVLAKGKGIAASTAIAAAVLGQGLALVAATLLGLASGWTLLEGTAWRWIVPVALLGGVLLALLPAVFRAVSGLWFRLAGSTRPEGLEPVAALRWFGVTLGSWLLYAGSFWVLVRGLGFEAAPVPTASAFAAAYVLGYVMVFAPAGIGVREGFLVVLLSPQLGPGASGAVAVIARIWTTLIEVIPAAAFWAHHLTTDDGAPKPRD